MSTADTIASTLRPMAPGGKLRPAEVDLINAMAEQWDRRRVPVAAPAPPAHGLHIGPEGIELIQSFEGCHKRRPDGMIEAYPDPGSSLSRTGSGSGDPWTIGWGSTGAGIRKGVVWTQEQCDDRLEVDLERYAADVRRAIGGAPTSQAQFDAMVSFHYNTGAIGKATLTKKHKAGDYAGVEREFGKWTKAGKRVMAGLVRRRAAEAELYARG